MATSLDRVSAVSHADNSLNMQAHRQAVNMSASSYFVPDFGSMQYLNYGAAVSEVSCLLNSNTYFSWHLGIYLKGPVP